MTRTRPTNVLLGTLPIVLAMIAGAGIGAAAGSGTVPEGPWLQYKDPQRAGFDPARLEALRAQADEAGSGAVVIVRNGHVVRAWGDIERKFKCHSMRKSFLSALYGPAVRQGKLDLSATIGELAIDDVLPLTDVEKTASVEQLLQARSGIYHPAAKEPESMKDARPERGTAAPGERFWYNNWDFNTAGTVYEQATGRGIFEAFRDDLAVPLGMEDFQIDDTTYQYERNLSRAPGYAFRLSARDSARFGLLYLRNGSWNGRLLIPREWIERSTRPQTDLGDGEGYAYMWWTYGPGTMPSRPELSAYAASGTGAQLIVVVPALDLVIVHRADTDFGRGVRSGDAWALVRGIIEAVEGDPKPAGRRHLQAVEALPFSRELPPLSFPRIVKLPGDQLERFTGRYRVSPEITVELRRLDDFLVGSMTGFGEADFFPIGPMEFWGKAVGATVRFEEGEGGGIAAAHVNFRGRQFRAVPIGGEGEPGYPQPPRARER